MMIQFIVAGIGTDVGKTVVSAVLTEALKATYWKPVQAGDLDHSDSMKVRSWCSSGCTVLPERFRLNTPASPHFAAECDGITISASDLALPDFENDRNVIIETAGGLMVPLNDNGLLYLDLIGQWKLPVFLVSRHYLGSINHTLLSIYALKQRKIELAGLIINGDRHEPSERIYRQHFPELLFSFIPELAAITPETISQSALQWIEQTGLNAAGK